jgi:hypothetical protein
MALDSHPRSAYGAVVSALGEIHADLVRFGTEISTSNRVFFTDEIYPYELFFTAIRALGSRVYPPQLIQYDQWG